MASTVTTDLNLLLNAKDAPALAEKIGKELAEAGYVPTNVEIQLISLSCEPDNMLVTQYEQVHGRPPVNEDLHRLLVNGTTELENKDATKAVVALLPEDTFYYGTTIDGTVELGGAPACAWRP